MVCPLLDGVWTMWCLHMLLKMEAYLGNMVAQPSNMMPCIELHTSFFLSSIFTENYWRSLSRSAHLISLAHTEAEKRELEEADTVSALASLSVGGDPHRRYNGFMIWGCHELKEISILPCFPCRSSAAMQTSV